MKHNHLGKLASAHILISLMDVGMEHLAWEYNQECEINISNIFWELGFNEVYNRKHHPVTLAEGTQSRFTIARAWVKSIGEGEYPRYHVLPVSIETVRVDGKYVLGIFLSAHIDSSRHRTDKGALARTQVQEVLEEIRAYFHAKFFGE